MQKKSTLFLLAAVLLGMTVTAMADMVVDSQNVVQLPANPTLDEPVVTKPVLIEGAFVSVAPSILTILPCCSQVPQPVVMRNYYLTPQAKKVVLPFWQGVRPLRLRNPFLGKPGK